MNTRYVLVLSGSISSTLRHIGSLLDSMNHITTINK